MVLTMNKLLKQKDVLRNVCILFVSQVYMLLFFSFSVFKRKPKTLYQASFCAKTSLSLRHRLQPQFKDETDRNSCISCQKTQHWLYLSHLLCKRCFKGKLLSSHSTVLIFQRWNIWSNSHRSLFKSAHWNDKYLSRLLRWHE